MTQMKPPQAVTLFDLIGREWDLGAGVRDMVFSRNGEVLAVALQDGHLACLRVADEEHPDKRMRIELETGRSTIRPREKPLPPPSRSEEAVAGAGGLVRNGDQGFAFVHRDGAEIWQATARAQTLRKVGAGPPVTALAAVDDRLVIARGAEVTILSGDDASKIAAIRLSHPVTRIAPSPDGRLLACWGAGGVSLLTSDSAGITSEVATGAAPLDLAFSPDGRWLVGGNADKSLVLVDIPAGKADHIVDFPAAVGSVAFSGPAGALLAGGAYRVVGWDLPDLPFGDHGGSAIQTGKPGLTLVDRVAAHPARDLCAVAYANGLVVICRIGHRDEMMLREGTGQPVTALEFSPDGSHLAIGGQDGRAALVSFPKNMFK